MYMAGPGAPSWPFLSNPHSRMSIIVLSDPKPPYRFLQHLARTKYDFASSAHRNNFRRFLHVCNDSPRRLPYNQSQAQLTTLYEYGVVGIHVISGIILEQINPLVRVDRFALVECLLKTHPKWCLFKFTKKSSYTSLCGVTTARQEHTLQWFPSGWAHIYWQGKVGNPVQ